MFSKEATAELLRCQERLDRANVGIQLTLDAPHAIAVLVTLHYLTKLMKAERIPCQLEEDIAQSILRELAAEEPELPTLLEDLHHRLEDN